MIRDISHELQILERAEEMLADKAALEMAKHQKISLWKGNEISVVESLVSEVLRARVLITALQSSKTHLIEDGLAKKAMEAIPDATFKRIFEQGTLNANKTTQDIALTGALDKITQRIRGLISIIEGATLFNISLVKKN